MNVNDGARVLHVLHAIHDTGPHLSLPLLLRLGPVRVLCGAGERRARAGLHGPEAKDKRIEPLNLPVVKDLVFDLLPQLEQIASFLPRRRSLPEEADVEPIKPLRTASNASAASRSARPST